MLNFSSSTKEKIIQFILDYFIYPSGIATSFICLFILLVTFISCHSDRKFNKSQNEIFRFNEAAGISSLDPAFASGKENIWAVSQLFNGLVRMDSNLNVQPCIAKSWDISSDGMTYTFHLRNDVYFQDSPVFPNGKGRKVIASDFVNSFYRILNPQIASPGRWIFKNLDRSEKSNHFGFTAPNDSTFKLFLEHPFPPFLGTLTMPYCYVVPHEAIDKFEGSFRRHPVGSGPFKFKMWEEGVKLIFVRNNNYFKKDSKGNSLPYLKGVSITFVKNEEIAFFEFMKGQLDFISGLNGKYKDQILNGKGELKDDYKDKMKMLKSPYLNTEYLGFFMDKNSKLYQNSPVKNKDVRLAINYGFNRAQMIKYLRSGIGIPARHGFVPAGLSNFDQNHVKGYYYDPDTSRYLLRKAGYPNGEGLSVIPLYTTPQYLDLCEFIQHQLQEVGIKIDINVNMPASHAEIVAKQQAIFFRKSWIADYPDPENYLALFYSKNFYPIGPNYTHFKNKKYDQLYEEAVNTVDNKKRAELYEQMDQIIIDEAPIVPLYYDEVVRFTSLKVHNLGADAMDMLDLRYVKKY